MAGHVAALFAAAVMAQAQPDPATDPPAGDAAPVAAPAAAPPVTSTAKTEKPKAEKICIEEAATGSLFRRKICATREEWARRRAKDQETMTDTGGAPMR